MALIVNSSGFGVFIQCENNKGEEIGWNGGDIHPGVTRYIQAGRIEGNGGTCECRVYSVKTTNEPAPGGGYVQKQTPDQLITSKVIKPHALWYFNGGSLTTDPTGLRFTDNSKRQGW
ncbi:MAG: hypothetical protein RID09_28715 [Coleofasciculus sp. G1-WW12-02]|uniref:hypothetical protein n=1 Tax=Coleofasciculus sp. G1-WW12-02 TaxID=3068483 RepID=UPI0032F8EC94